jgi:hypothetical protein
MMFGTARIASRGTGMQVGKSSKDFDAYVRNLHRAFWLSSVGAQLNAGENGRIRGAMVHNPYTKTIADLNICQVRSETPL